MHPSIGAEWIDNATDGDRLAPTIYVEVIGINYWNENQPLVQGLVAFQPLRRFTCSYRNRQARNQYSRSWPTADLRQHL